jgi:hypothetical protein
MRRSILFPILLTGSLPAVAYELQCGFGETVPASTCEWAELEAPCHSWIETMDTTLEDHRDRGELDWHINYQDEMRPDDCTVRDITLPTILTTAIPSILFPIC